MARSAEIKPVPDVNPQEFAAKSGGTPIVEDGKISKITYSNAEVLWENVADQSSGENRFLPRISSNQKELNGKLATGVAILKKDSVTVIYPGHLRGQPKTIAGDIFSDGSVTPMRDNETTASNERKRAKKLAVQNLGKLQK